MVLSSTFRCSVSECGADLLWQLIRPLVAAIRRRSAAAAAEMHAQTRFIDHGWTALASRASGASAGNICGATIRLRAAGAPLASRATTWAAAGSFGAACGCILEGWRLVLASRSFGRNPSAVNRRSVSVNTLPTLPAVVAPVASMLYTSQKPEGSPQFDRGRPCDRYIRSC